MACRITQYGIVCGPKPRAKPCAFCRTPSTKLCDFPIEEKQPSLITMTMSRIKTCDKPLCDSCAVHRGPDLDYCPNHIQPRAIKQSV